MFEFEILKKLGGGSAPQGRSEKNKKSSPRAGIFNTPHGKIPTPAFATVGTKANVKGLTPEMVNELGSEIFLANTYHLYFYPGDKIIKKAGGLHRFTNWKKPIMTDSGGFQVFSLGAAYGKEGVSKIAKEESGFLQEKINQNKKSKVKISEEGALFFSPKDGSKHFFTPEFSMEVQQNLGADIIFAFDECVGSQASYNYQKEAMERTHRWALRCVEKHKEIENKKGGIIKKMGEKILKQKKDFPQALFGVVQGGNFLDLREESADFLGKQEYFSGFGIGGAFLKEDIEKIVSKVNEVLPEEKPRHLLGIGEVEDLFAGVEAGVDFFDCVAPSRMARHGSLHTENGKINIKKSLYKEDFTPIEKNCECYVCKNFTKAYVHHLIREREMLGSTLATIHNLYFVVNLVKKIRQSILEENFFSFKKEFLKKYL